MILFTLLIRWITYLLLFVTGCVLVAAACVAIVIAIIYPRLPGIGDVENYQPKIPLRIFTADGYLIGEFGEERRTVVGIKDFPDLLKNAVLAIEDDRFYQHSGVDLKGVLRAAYSNLTGGRSQGASTITMQVARNFFLSPEKTYARKLYEVLLTHMIESTLSKDQILELYLNQIFLGQKAHGFSAAAQIYFGKPLQALTIAEAAMLAGIPQSPSKKNPVANPKAAKIRQSLVLQRMRDLKYISEDQYKAAMEEEIIVKRNNVENYPVHADYVAEMARQIAVDRYQGDAYSLGLRVITTITKEEQDAAYAALRQGVLDYDQRHGYRGAEAHIDLSNIDLEQDDDLDDLLLKYPDADELKTALVLKASAQEVEVYRRGESKTIKLSGDAIKLAKNMLDNRAPADKRLTRGAIIRIVKNSQGSWRIAQLPEVEAALVAVNPESGRIEALVGGFDFNRNKFNHATQAWRQPGSSFKPFIYSASLEKCYSPGSYFFDEPIIVPSSETGGPAWAPKNYDGRYDGPMTMRTALARSKNMVSVRILQAISPRYAQDFVTKFGFDAEKHPPYLTMALGAGSVTPWQMVRAYSTFANGGNRITPYIVAEIRDSRDRVIARFYPEPAGTGNQRVIDPRNAYLMNSLLNDVTIRGTAAKAGSQLKRRDLAGKTGTTNEHVDAWFCGYQATNASCVWIGFDDPANKLGRGETGGLAALPMWIEYMSKSLKGIPEKQMDRPAGIIAAGGDLLYKECTPPVPPLIEEDPLLGVLPSEGDVPFEHRSAVDHQNIDITSPHKAPQQPPQPPPKYQYRKPTTIFESIDF